jgi:hypothetical protein
LNGCVMNEYIRATILSQETVTLAIIEPLDCTNYTIGHIKNTPLLRKDLIPA